MSLGRAGNCSPYAGLGLGGSIPGAEPDLETPSWHRVQLPGHGGSLLPLCSPKPLLEQPHPFSFPFLLEIRPHGSAEADVSPQARHSPCLHLTPCALPAFASPSRGKEPFSW